ncbi:MAG: peptidylprolyl isomerase [bacterium]
MRHVLSIIALLVLIAGCGAETETPAAVTPEPAELAAVPATGDEQPAPGGALSDTLTAENLPEALFLTIEVAEFGAIKVKFHAQDAPRNVTNVANLAIKGFYDGLAFHRIIPSFVVQGGDPKGDGTGGPGYTVEAEMKRKHLKGSLAMARTGDQVNPERRSSGSQFYLCLEALPQLDAGGYTVIGDLVEGMDVLERIGAVQTSGPPLDRPVEPVVMTRVYVTTD